jgi:glycosyltransferase involved in cell wall biosynthesis
MLVVEALSKLRRKGIRIHVVMVGLLADSRDPSNQAISKLLQAMASGGVGDQITLLGMVPEEDLINLMRVAAVVIQPSRFEGWSTPVQDAKALGRPLICSDIPVHREQAPGALGFVRWDDPDTLAELMAETWKSLEPGPNPALESQCMAREHDFAGIFGEKLLKICREACSN